MGTMTINLDSATENSFRNYVSKEYGTNKGVLGKAVREALNKWLKEKSQDKIAKEAIASMKKGFNSGGFKIKSRDELHERWNNSIR